jgi:hypothetical protein
MDLLMIQQEQLKALTMLSVKVYMYIITTVIGGCVRLAVLAALIASIHMAESTSAMSTTLYTASVQLVGLICYNSTI